jgi:hypothetical protein
MNRALKTPTAVFCAIRISVVLLFLVLVLLNFTPNEFRMFSLKSNWSSDPRGLI